MSTPEEAFGTLLGRQPSDKERQALYRARDALQLRDNDALWLLLIALGHYETLYGRLPGLIEDTAKGALNGVKAAAEAQMKASAATTELELSEAVARTAERIARDAARGSKLRWAAACLVASLVSLVLVGWLSQRSAGRAGYARGWKDAYWETLDHKAAASWASTPEGQLAYALAKVGVIRELATCSGRGWIQRGGVCIPRPENGAVHGWRMPTKGSCEGP